MYLDGLANSGCFSSKNIFLPLTLVLKIWPKKLFLAISQISFTFQYFNPLLLNYTDLVAILARYIFVDKTQPTFWNGLSLIIGFIAIISYIGSIQLISSRTLVQGYGVGVSNELRYRPEKFQLFRWFQPFLLLKFTLFFFFSDQFELTYVTPILRCFQLVLNIFSFCLFVCLFFLVCLFVFQQRSVSGLKMSHRITCVFYY